MMTTRIGKIAHIPHHLREQLNLRLLNGARGPELMKWLNALPEVQSMLAEFFNASPINRQNLTEWRHGGYEEWVRHQERELRIQRIAEEGAGLHECEGDDLFENAARITIAEHLADLDALHELKGEKRTNRLRALTADLARLQNAYNRSRWALLAWTKWNDRFLGPDDYEHQTDTSQTRSAQLHCAASPSCTPQAITSSETSETSRPAQIPNAQNTADFPEIKPIQTNSTGGDASLGASASRPAQPPTSPVREDSLALPVPAEINDRVYIRRTIYHPKGCDCICRTCHPEDGDYPYTEALKDHTEAKQQGVRFFWRGRTGINTRPAECNCPCEDCQPTKNTQHNLPPPAISPISPISPISEPLTPNADFLRQMALLKARRQ